jgi:hypothetical protein
MLPLQFLLTVAEPWSYLRDVCCPLPRWPKHQLLELAGAPNAATDADSLQSTLFVNVIERA